MSIALQTHGGRRQRTPFHPPHAPPHQISSARANTRLLKRQLLSRLIGAIHPPAQAAYRGLQSDLVYTDLHGRLAVFLDPSGPTPVRSHDARRGVVAIAQPQELFDSIALDNRHYRLT